MGINQSIPSQIPKKKKKSQSQNPLKWRDERAHSYASLKRKKK